MNSDTATIIDLPASKRFLRVHTSLLLVSVALFKGVLVIMANYREPNPEWLCNPREIDDRIASGSLTPLMAEQFAKASVEIIMSQQNQFGRYQQDATAVLCRLATSLKPEIAELGVSVLFRELVEPLSDAFLPTYCLLYDQIFAEVIDYCRNHPKGSRLDSTLRNFGLYTYDDIIARKSRLRLASTSSQNGLDKIRHCVVLSRVTIGAEVAVTSVVISKLLTACPDAEIRLLADPSVQELFQNLSRVRVDSCPYPRGQTLFQRFDRWLDVLATIESQTRSLPSSHYLVIDPDSRLSQLGLLPVVQDDTRYLFFESRGYQYPDLHTMSELTAQWLSSHFGGERVRPFISLSTSSRSYAHAVRDRFSVGTLTGLNLNVGGNNRKRVGTEFELRLLRTLSSLGNNTVLLFQGTTKEEQRIANDLVDKLASLEEKCIIKISGGDTTSLPPDRQADVIVWGGEPLGVYGALIGETDFYVGYDSSGQHIAAALGVPTIDIFHDSTPPPVHSERWTPTGMGKVTIIRAAETSVDECIKQIVECFHLAMK